MIETDIAYCDTVINDQEKKIQGLQCSVRDLELRLIAYRAVLKDANRDMSRFLSHRASLISGDPITPLQLD